MGLVPGPKSKKYEKNLKKMRIGLREPEIAPGIALLPFLYHLPQLQVVKEGVAQEHLKKLPEFRLREHTIPALAF